MIVNAMVYLLHFEIFSLKLSLLSNGSLKCAQCSRELFPYVLKSSQGMTRNTLSVRGIVTNLREGCE